MDDYPFSRIEFPRAVETVGELRSLDEQTIISKLLAGEAAARMDRSLRENAAQVAERFHKNLGNFAPDPATRTYTERQMRDFTDRWIIEQDIKVAYPQHPNIPLLRPPLPERSFLSSRMHTSLVFWKYYLGQRKPKKLSDLGDRGHSTLFPYCTEIVTEKDQANVVRQLRRRIPSLFLADGRTLTMTDFFAKARDPSL